MQFEAEIARREKMLGTGLGERMNSLRGVKEVSWDAEGRGNVKFCRDCCQAQFQEDAEKAQSMAGMEERKGSARV